MPKARTMLTRILTSLGSTFWGGTFFLSTRFGRSKRCGSKSAASQGRNTLRQPLYERYVMWNELHYIRINSLTIAWVCVRIVLHWTWLVIHFGDIYVKGMNQLQDMYNVKCVYSVRFNSNIHIFTNKAKIWNNTKILAKMSKNMTFCNATIITWNQRDKLLVVHIHGMFHLYTMTFII